MNGRTQRLFTENLSTTDAQKGRSHAVYFENHRSIQKHDGSGDVSRPNGDKMREELRQNGIDTDVADPILVFAKIKGWKFEHLNNPLKRIEMTNIVLLFKIHSLCKPNDSRPHPDTASERETIAIIGVLETFIERCAERQSRLGAVKSRDDVDAAAAWFHVEHAKVVRRFELYLKGQNIPG